MEEPKVEQPVETEEQKIARADACLAELGEVLKKHNCIYKVVYTVTSDGKSEFLVLTETK